MAGYQPPETSMDEAEDEASGWHGVALGALSITAAAYGGWLTAVKLASQYACDGTGLSSCGGEGSGCGLALSSAWSEIGGWPTTIAASAFYCTMLCFGVAWIRRADALPRHFRPILLVAALANVAVSIAMAAYAKLALNAFCKYCAGLYLASLMLLVLALFAHQEAPLEALMKVIGFQWLDRSAASTLAWMAVTFGALFWLQGMASDSYAATASTVLCQTQEAISLPESKLMMGDASAQVTAAEFIDLSCPHCRRQSQDLDEWVRTDLKQLQVRIYAFPRDIDNRCCDGCTATDSSSARTCLAALVLECVVQEHAPGEARSFLSALWAQQAAWESQPDKTASTPMFTEGILADLVTQTLHRSESWSFVRECLDNTAIQESVRAQVRAGEKARRALPPGEARLATPFTFLFSSTAGPLQGVAGFLAGEKDLITWKHRVGRTLLAPRAPSN